MYEKVHSLIFALLIKRPHLKAEILSIFHLWVIRVANVILCPDNKYGTSLSRDPALAPLCNQSRVVPYTHQIPPAHVRANTLDNVVP